MYLTCITAAICSFLTNQNGCGEEKNWDTRRRLSCVTILADIQSLAQIPGETCRTLQAYPFIKCVPIAFIAGTVHVLMYIVASSRMNRDQELSVVCNKRERQLDTSPLGVARSKDEASMPKSALRRTKPPTTCSQMIQKDRRDALSERPGASWLTSSKV